MSGGDCARRKVGSTQLFVGRLVLQIKVIRDAISGERSVELKVSQKKIINKTKHGNRAF